MPSSDLSRRIARIEDERAIVALAVRYGVVIDGKDWDGLRALFTADASGDYSTPVATVDDLVTNAQRLNSVEVTHHAMSNHEVELDGEEATHRCHVVAFHSRAGADGGDTFTIFGAYSDQLVRTPNGWRIRFRRLALWHGVGNPGVVPPPD